MVRSSRSARPPTLYRCVYTNDPLACASVSRSGGTGNVTQIRGILQNIAGIRTDGIDLNLAYRTRLAEMGDFGLTWNNTFLSKYDVSTPTAGGNVVEHRRRIETGQPEPGLSPSGSRSASSIGTASGSARR